MHLHCLVTWYMGLGLSLTVVVFFTVKGDQRVDSFDIIWRAVLIESSEKGSCFCIL